MLDLRSKKSSLSNLTAKEASSIAKDLSVPVKDVIEMEKRMGNYDIAMDDNDEENMTPSDFLKSCLLYTSDAADE